ncbi:MAG: polyhydroxyalkanoic acid system family protein [Methylobacteriaceae bacterium]|nr:polyhydroxyalkanoic acid system family protein [Methylobacteriaceae bacterium]MBV9636875.1 polyhydroxyalkanoic acid system family protein [Methylobacteriaceae bacterium]MBV9701113.1 polyhydroxyalkanoic acid system family protein [Methylobacteriaceae bacterium]
MSKPLVVTISHSLGKEEALRRLQGGLAETMRLLANKVVLVENAWTDNRANFSVRAVGQTVTGTIEVEADVVRLEAQLPWLLAMFAERVKTYIASRGTLLLGRK